MGWSVVVEDFVGPCRVRKIYQLTRGDAPGEDIRVEGKAWGTQGLLLHLGIYLGRYIGDHVIEAAVQGLASRRLQLEHPSTLACGLHWLTERSTGLISVTDHFKFQRRLLSSPLPSKKIV